jgi:hypothetical protein
LCISFGKGYATEKKEEIENFDNGEKD